ncbi:MAG TPA: M20/M25/M40 family metallo-hydrolase [Cyclobacteriaceae bacterium]|nr:M20/M25/M40 family metallo-hydrolase [Cyclobacteriaceae bacterium]
MRLIPVLLLITSIGFAQQVPVKNYVNKPENQIRWLNEYREFLSIPNVLGDSMNMIRNANWIKAFLESKGVKAQLLSSGQSRSAPVVFGEVKTAGAKTTLAFYAHYDGQPVNPKQWADGLEPFKPVLASDRLDLGGKIIPFPANVPANPSDRLYGRGSSDDKAGVFAILAAYESLIASGARPTVNIKFFFEGEEEAGSVHLADIFAKYKELIQADQWVICDGPRHISGRKQIVFGVRGDVNVDIKVYGSKRPLHSGNYGNWAPNPAMRLVQLLASMKDDKGMVTIPEFYDDVTPLSEMERKAVAAIPPVESILQEDLALARPDGDGRSFMELLTIPTLNINGIQSANIGAMAANVIPTEATAVIDLRLVAGNDVDRQVNKLISYVQSKGYTVLDHEPTDAERRQFPLIAKITKRKGGYNAQRTPMDLPIAQQIIKAMERTVDYPVIKVPSAGGSLPLFLYEQLLNTQPVTIPVVNYDNNQHAENENIMLKYLWEGIETMAAVMQVEQPVAMVPSKKR